MSELRPRWFQSALHRWSADGAGLRWPGAAAAVAVVAAGLLGVAAQGQGPKLDARDTTVAASIPGVVAAGTKVELVHEGALQGSDGIVTMPDGSVVFIELGTTHLRRLTADGALSTVTEVERPRALTVDPKGRILTLFMAVPQGRPGYLGIVHPPGAVATIAETIGGRPLSTSNDVAISTKGAIYMTDAGTLFKPPYEEPTFIHYFPADGSAPRDVAGPADRLVMPNGIVLSPDERTLYVNDSRGEAMVAWDVRKDGSLANRREFARYNLDAQTLKDFPYHADGLAVDADGRVYAAMPLGVYVYSAKGERLGTIPITKKGQSLTFGGPDRKTLFIAAQGSIWKVRTEAHGPKNRAR